MKAHRPTIMGRRHMIAATQYLAAQAGFRILEAGGNAIDAGAAAGIALGVVQPEFVNVAGVAPRSQVSAPGPKPSSAIISAGTTAAIFQTASCAPWYRRRPMPGSPRSNADRK